MATKIRASTDTAATQLALQRTIGPAVPPGDHNELANLRARDAQLWINLCPNGIVAAATPRCVIDTTAVRIDVPTVGLPILAMCRGMWIDMGAECEETGTVTAATLTTLTDTGLEAASNDFWKYAWVIFTSGAYAGTARQVSAYDATAHKLTFAPALAGIPTVGTTYVVTFFYIESLTNSVLNYVYMTVGSWTPLYGIARFYANTTGSPDNANDLLVATVTLNGSGVVTASSNAPTGAARYLYPLFGRYDNDVQSVTVHEAVAAGGTVAAFDATHDQMAAVSGLEVSLSDANFTYEITKAYEDDRVTLTITNGGAYAADCTVTVTRKGVKLQQLA